MSRNAKILADSVSPDGVRLIVPGVWPIHAEKSRPEAHRHAEAVQQTQRGFRECPPYRCKKCDACMVEKLGCACDGAVDDGCFLCSSERHERPECPTEETT